MQATSTYLFRLTRAWSDRAVQAREPPVVAVALVAAVVVASASDYVSMYGVGVAAAVVGAAAS